MLSRNESHFGPLPSLPWPLRHVRLISFLGLIRAALLCFSSLPVSLLIPALRGLSQNSSCRCTFLRYENNYDFSLDPEPPLPAAAGGFLLLFCAGVNHLIWCPSSGWFVFTSVAALHELVSFIEPSYSLVK